MNTDNSSPHILVLRKMWVKISREEGWSLTRQIEECGLETWLASDHPVCGNSERGLFFDAAATPPHEEGNDVSDWRSKPLSKVRRFENKGILRSFQSEKCPNSRSQH